MRKIASFLKKLKVLPTTTQTEVSGHANVDPSTFQSLLNRMLSEVYLMNESMEENSIETIMQPASVVRD